MPALQIDSVEEPFRSRPELAMAALRLFHTSRFLGAVPESAGRVLDWDFVLALGAALGGGRPSPTLIEMTGSRERLLKPPPAPDDWERVRR